MSAWELAGLMSDDTLQRILDDLQAVPLLPEALVEGYADGQWLYGPCCAACGYPLDRRRFGCVTCINRHEKRRQRGGRAAPAALLAPWQSRRGRQAA